MEQKYNIIGDTHGRTAWKDLVISDGINIFVGDYFSPYVSMSFEDQLNNFLSIIDYKIASFLYRSYGSRMFLDVSVSRSH